jgi:hypothetical protein
MVTFRHRPTRTSLRMYFKRIGGFLPGLRVLLLLQLSMGGRSPVQP